MRSLHRCPRRTRWKRRRSQKCSLRASKASSVPDGSCGGAGATMATGAPSHTRSTSWQMKGGTFLGLPQSGEVCTVLNTVVIPQVPLFSKVVFSPVVVLQWFRSRQCRNREVSACRSWQGCRCAQRGNDRRYDQIVLHTVEFPQAQFLDKVYADLDVTGPVLGQGCRARVVQRQVFRHDSQHCFFSDSSSVGRRSLCRVLCPFFVVRCASRLRSWEIVKVIQLARCGQIVADRGRSW